MAKAKVTNRNEALIMKLCINARDAMPTDGRLLTETEMVELDDTYCRSYPHVVRGRYAVVSVSDTGVGMDAETSGYSQDGANLPKMTGRMAYLQKPYSPTALSKLVRNVLGRHAARQN